MILTTAFNEEGEGVIDQATLGSSAPGFGEAEHVPMDDQDLMGIRADTAYTYDARGRMLRSNEPREDARRLAPRLFLGRTSAGHVVRVGTTVPDVLTRRLEAIIGRQSPVGPLRVPTTALVAVREALARHAPVTSEKSGPAYRFPASIVRSDEVVRLTEANRALARETYPWLYDEVGDWQPCFAVVRDNAAVSVCFSSRIGVVAAEAGVETLPEFRGRGYAVAVTAAWGVAVRADGRIALYSTAWENVASQAVARRVGLIMFGADAKFS